MTKTYCVLLHHQPSGRETSMVVTATSPDEALTIAERSGVDYTEAQVREGNICGLVVAEYGQDEEWERTFAIGARVSVLRSHWNPTRHGKTGTVKSAVESAEGKPTHWVGFDTGGGEFVHADDLQPLSLEGVHDDRQDSLQ